MGFLQNLEALLGHHQAPASPPHAVQPAQTSQTQSPPDITYNPNPNTNIPYSTHDLALVAAGNRYVANPTSKEFIGVDPKIFGFPADNTANYVQSALHQLMALSQPSHPQPNLDTGAPVIQGQTNPGYTPLQNSGFGPGGNPQIRAFNNPQMQQFNPQIRNNGNY